MFIANWLVWIELKDLNNLVTQLWIKQGQRFFQNWCLYWVWFKFTCVFIKICLIYFSWLPYVGTWVRRVRWTPPPKNSKSGFTPPKRSAHPSRVRRGCFDPPSPKIKAVGCANPYPPRKILNPRKKFFTQVGRNFKIFQFFYIFTNFIINEKCWN